MAGIFKVLGSVGNGIVSAVETVEVTLEAGRIASKGLMAVSADFTAATEKQLSEKAAKGGYEARYQELLNEANARVS